MRRGSIVFTKRFPRESEKKLRRTRETGGGRGGNTFPLAQFNPGAAREDGASEIERINAEERRFRSGTTAI